MIVVYTACILNYAHKIAVVNSYARVLAAVMLTVLTVLRVARWCSALVPSMPLCGAMV